MMSQPEIDTLVMFKTISTDLMNQKEPHKNASI